MRYHLLFFSTVLIRLFKGGAKQHVKEVVRHIRSTDWYRI